MSKDLFAEFEFDRNDRFIDLSKNYSEVMLGQFYPPGSEQNYVELIWTTNQLTKDVSGNIVRVSMEQLKELNLFVDVEKRKGFKLPFQTELSKILKNVWFEVVNEIYNSPKHRVSLDDCLELIVTRGAVSIDIAVAISKLKIAKGHLLYKQLKKGEFIELGHGSLEFENRKRYLSSISSEIYEKSKRIERIINHGQTKGNYREELLRSVLKKYIPTRYHIATGFIDGCAKQVDILIYDVQNYIPLFREEDLVVVRKESVVAAIEVKTTLDANTLKNALEGFSKLTEVGTLAAPFFKGLFAFESSFNNQEDLAKKIIEYYAINEIEALYDHIDIICVPGKHCQLINYNNLENERNSIPVLNSLISSKGIDIEETMFFQSIFNNLETDYSARLVNKRYFTALENTAIETEMGPVTADDWTPIVNFYSEQEEQSKTGLTLEDNFAEILQFNIHQAKCRIEMVENWRWGMTTREELVRVYFQHGNDIN